MTYPAEMRCMFCGCLLGMKEGFLEPDLVSHGLGECCAEWARDVWDGLMLERAAGVRLDRTGSLL